VLFANLRHRHRINDQCDTSVPQNGGTGNAGNICQIVAERLDGHLLLSNQAGNHEPHPLLGGTDHHDVTEIIRFTSRLDTEYSLQPDQRQHYVAQFQNLLPADYMELPLIYPDGFQDGRERDGVDFSLNFNQQGLNNCKSKRQPKNEF